MATSVTLKIDDNLIAFADRYADLAGYASGTDYIEAALHLALYEDMETERAMEAQEDFFDQADDDLFS